MSEEGERNDRGVSVSAAEHSTTPLPPNYYYGTFQGVANYQSQPSPPSEPVMGFPQPIPPAGFSSSPVHNYPLRYQTVQGYAVAEGRPLRGDRLPCCGVGIGWFLFIIGFFLGAIPWYIGAFLLLCVQLDYREKPGLFACMLAALLATLVVTFGVTKATHSW